MITFLCKGLYCNPLILGPRIGVQDGQLKFLLTLRAYISQQLKIANKTLNVLETLNAERFRVIKVKFKNTEHHNNTRTLDVFFKIKKDCFYPNFFEKIN